MPASVTDRRHNLAHGLACKLRQCPTGCSRRSTYTYVQVRAAAQKQPRGARTRKAFNNLAHVSTNSYAAGSNASLSHAVIGCFLPQLCRPYRAQTKGKVERFIRYLRHSFWVPLDSRLRPLGVKVDAATANIEVRKWLRDTANVRLHGTTASSQTGGRAC